MHPRLYSHHCESDEDKHFLSKPLQGGDKSFLFDRTRWIVSANASDVILSKRVGIARDWQ